MKDVAGILSRHAETAVRVAMADTRVVLINGARQSGKTTMVNALAPDFDNVEVRSLDVPALLEAARADPTSFVRHPGALVIDEVQRAPELFLPIKHEVDTDPRPGRFLLTGSARILGLKSLPDALPGRVETVELWPLSQGEIEQRTDRFVDWLFSPDQPRASELTPITRDELIARLTRGGMPEATRRSDPRRRSALLNNYVSDLIERDVRDLSAIESADEFRRMLHVVAARTGQILAASRIASDLNISGRTVARYLELAEEVFLLKRIPAWSPNLAKRAISAPKAALVDSGIAAALLGHQPARLALPGNQQLGPLVEGFATMELMRQLSWSDEDVRLYHYRTKDQVEVDAVLETTDGRIAGVEIKSAASVSSRDFSGLRHLRGVAGDAFALGVVLYAGDRALSFGESLWALPFTALWELQPRPGT